MSSAARTPASAAAGVRALTWIGLVFTVGPEEMVSVDPANIASNMHDSYGFSFIGSYEIEMA